MQESINDIILHRFLKKETTEQENNENDGFFIVGEYPA